MLTSIGLILVVVGHYGYQLLFHFTDTTAKQIARSKGESTDDWRLKTLDTAYYVGCALLTLVACYWLWTHNAP